MTRTRAPRKYLDPERTVVTQEWLAWRDASSLVEAEQTRDRIRFFGDEETYYPEESGKDLGEGSWIFVIDPPHGLQPSFHLPVLSIWYARPHRLSTGRIGSRSPYQAVIQTPDGDLHLWPREYALCSDIKTLIGFEGVELNSLGGDPVLDEDQLFYLLSRGIPREEAIVMLFDQIKSQNYCYITLPDYAVQMFAGVGTSLRSHVHRSSTLV